MSIEEQHHVHDVTKDRGRGIGITRVSVSRTEHQQLERKLRKDSDPRQGGGVEKEFQR